MANDFDARRKFLDAASKYLLDAPKKAVPEPAPFVPPRLTFTALQEISMSRSRDRILANLEEMYTEAFNARRSPVTTRRWRRWTLRIGASSCTSRSCWTCGMRWSGSRTKDGRGDAWKTSRVAHFV
jgi:hypothetical protein